MPAGVLLSGSSGKVPKHAWAGQQGLDGQQLEPLQM